jgi:predicted DNA-binding protein (MmcQ/YjbR family)
VRLDRLKAFALAQRQTTVVSQWGGLVYKVAGKVFLMLILDGGMIDGVIFKCTPEEFDGLTALDGITQAPYCAKRMWVRVGDLAALPERELQARIIRSRALVVAKLPKKVQAALAL